MTAATQALLQAVGWASASLSAFGDRLGDANTPDAEPLRPSILPKNYLAEFIAGTFGPASSGKRLTRHLESEQNVRRVVTRTNLGVMAAQDLEVSSKRKLVDINATRAVKFKHTISLIADHVLSSTSRAQDRPHVIREVFYFDDSPLAQQIAVRMNETHFIQRLAEQGARLADGALASLRRDESVRDFVDMEGHFRAELASFIPAHDVDENGTRRPVGDDRALKIINRVFDTLAPRMILIGHSQGGLIALRTMQLGMRHVQVKDARRFLYSPRSGRVHRYSPVAFAIGLGTPYDGIDTTPPEFNRGRAEALTHDDVPDLVRALMPGVDQMIHGSDFLKTLRGAFIPFDCSAISIANPKDGFVPPDRTRLPVGDFKNMHNLDVRSSAHFDVAHMAPGLFRRAFDLWPTNQLRALLNEDPRFEGLRQHCSFLFDLDANWNVDNGEILRQIFSGEHSQDLFDEMMYQVNFTGLREQLMANLLYKLRRASDEQRAALSWMVPRLRYLIREEALPFLNSVDKRASLALNYIERQ